MSLRYALLDLLAGEPMSGYDLTKVFSLSLDNVWPAQHSQIYPELARLVRDGLISQTGDGPRGRKVYSITPQGIDAIRNWLRETEPDYAIRAESILRLFCLWALPTDEALAYLERDRIEYQRHAEEMALQIASLDWSANVSQRGARLTIEFGYRYYRGCLDWIDWAKTQIEAGMLRAGGPMPVFIEPPPPSLH